MSEFQLHVLALENVIKLQLITITMFISPILIMGYFYVFLNNL